MSDLLNIIIKNALLHTEEIQSEVGGELVGNVQLAFTAVPYGLCQMGLYCIIVLPVTHSLFFWIIPP